MTDRSARSQAKADYYAHTESVVADVVCDEDAQGIWVAGNVRPDWLSQNGQSLVRPPGLRVRFFTIVERGRSRLSRWIDPYPPQDDDDEWGC